MIPLAGGEFRKTKEQEATSILGPTPPNPPDVLPVVITGVQVIIPGKGYDDLVCLGSA